MQIKVSIKHLQINKANNTMFIAVAIAAILTVFSLVSAKALWAQSGYQRKVLGEREKAVKQLQDNLKAAQELKTQFDVFASQDPNIIGGAGGDSAKDSDGAKDGDNAKIVLDALPSQYDFPAVISSVEKIAKTENVSLQSITGVDEGKDGSVPVTTDASAVAATSTGDVSGGAATPMPFAVTAITSYKQSRILIRDFERSIRPIDITTFSLTGTSRNLTTNIQANTYYQPGITLKIEEEVVE